MDKKGEQKSSSKASPESRRKVEIRESDSPHSSDDGGYKRWPFKDAATESEQQLPGPPKGPYPGFRSGGFGTAFTPAEASAAGAGATGGLGLSGGSTGAQPPVVTASPERSEKLYAARHLMQQAQYMGSPITMAEALHLINEERRDAAAAAAATAARPSPVPFNLAHPPAERLLRIERSMPTFDGSGLVSDFIHKFSQKLAQQGIMDDLDRMTILHSKLEGKAFTAVRANPTLCLTYMDTMAFLKATYGPSVAGIKAQLLGLKFHPSTESVRQFNERFNTIAASAPTGTISSTDIGQYYIQAIGRGDDLLMRDIIWGTDLGRASIAEIQRLVVDKLDSYSIYTTQTAVGSGVDAPASAYKPVFMDDSVSVAASDAATANSSIAQLMKEMQDMKAAQLAKPQPTQPSQPAARTAAVANQGSANRWQETRTCHICKKVGHISPNCPEKEKRSQMVSRAVGYVLDHIDLEGISSAGQLPAAPVAATGYAGANLVGCNMPAYAAQNSPSIRSEAAKALVSWDKAPTPKGKQQVLAGFAGALAQYCSDYPTEERALYYLGKVRGFGEEALEEMMVNGESQLATRILAERSRRSISTQAGDRGVAPDLWPGITDMLGNIPAKTNIFEWLKESQMFCTNVIELAMEIVMDKGWPVNFQRMYDDIVAAREQRKFGEYAADTRAQQRMHVAEQLRISQARPHAVEMDSQQDRPPRKSRWDQPGTAQIEQLMTGAVQSVPAMLLAQATSSPASYSFEAARAQLESEFGPTEDLTSLAGPPTPHHTMQVVLMFDGRAVKVTAIRDTGAPDTIMTQALYRHLNLKGHTSTSKNFVGLGAAPTSYLGIYKPLVMRITPRIKISHQAYISPDSYCLLILGNDIFNKEVVETLSQNDHVGCYHLRYGNILDTLPYKQLSIEERAAREKAYEQDELERELKKKAEAEAKTEFAVRKTDAGLRALSLQDDRPEYEKATELLLASRLAQQAIDATQYPQVPPRYGGIIMSKEATVQLPDSETAALREEDLSNEVAYSAYEAALSEYEQSFL